MEIDEAEKAGVLAQPCPRLTWRGDISMTAAEAIRHLEPQRRAEAPA